MTPSPNEPISPLQVDELCQKFNSAKTAVEAATATFTVAKAALQTAIEAHGYVPTNAEKTRRLDGVVYLANATTSATVTVEVGSVNQLELELSRFKIHKLFSKLFDRTVKYSLKKGAGDLLKATIAKMPNKTRERVASLYASCFSVETKSPSITVESISARREKDAKAAAKASKRKPSPKGGSK